MKQKKFLPAIIALNFLLATLPGFSIFKANASAAPEQLVVDFRSSQAEQAAAKDPAVFKLQRVFSGSSAPEFKNIFKIETTYSLADFRQIYGDSIIYADPENGVVAGSVSVNDPGFTIDASNVDREWALVKAHFFDAWDKTKGSPSAIVAVIDTGVDGTHEDLSAGQIGAGFDFMTNNPIPAGANSDDNGHGTLIAGVIAATPNNFRGIVGTDWNATIMPLKALDSTGAGGSSDVAAAIVYAADHNASVINLSLGGVGFANDTTLSNAISYAYAKNVVIVAAAGNDVATTGGNLDTNPVFPICDDNGQNMVIGVAASDQNDQKASFSNYGKNCVDVSAPGKHILSTINHEPLTHVALANSYAYASGTSLAAPFVSGEAALIKSLYPQATSQEIRDRILNSTEPIDQNNLTQCAGGPCAGLLGRGRINASAALDPNLSITLADGSLVRSQSTQLVYLINGGQKHQVSDFVLEQRFTGQTPSSVPGYVIDPIPTGSFALPADGTLVKTAQDPTVFEMISGFKRPITFQIWQQRGLKSQQINILSGQEMSSWVTGKFLPPVEGALVKSSRNPTVYWVIDGLLHPMNRAFYLERGLNHFPIVTLSGNDIQGYAVGAAYIR